MWKQAEQFMLETICKLIKLVQMQLESNVGNARSQFRWFLLSFFI